MLSRKYEATLSSSLDLGGTAAPRTREPVLSAVNFAVTVSTGLATESLKMTLYRRPTHASTWKDWLHSHGIAVGAEAIGC